jgi:hypothetical protein
VKRAVVGEEWLTSIVWYSFTSFALEGSSWRMRRKSWRELPRRSCEEGLVVIVWSSCEQGLLDRAVVALSIDIR